MSIKSVALSVSLAVVSAAAGLHAQAGKTTVDPAAPVIVTMSRGTIEVVGAATNAVSWELHGVRHDSSVAIQGPWNRGLTYDDALRIDITPPGDAGLSQLNLRITVPRAIKLLHLRLTAGNISVTGFDGDLVVESDSGNVHGAQLGGGVVIETRDGGIDVAVSSASPKHAISLIARNGAVTLGVPANGMDPLDIRLSCDLGNGSGTLTTQAKSLEALGIRYSQSGCDSSDRMVNGVKVTEIGQQALEGTWTDGGAAISVRTLRGSIVFRLR